MGMGAEREVPSVGELPSDGFSVALIHPRACVNKRLVCRMSIVERKISDVIYVIP